MRLSCMDGASETFPDLCTYPFHCWWTAPDKVRLLIEWVTPGRGVSSSSILFFLNRGNRPLLLPNIATWAVWLQKCDGLWSKVLWVMRISQASVVLGSWCVGFAFGTGVGHRFAPGLYSDDHPCCLAVFGCRTLCFGYKQNWGLGKFRDWSGRWCTWNDCKSWTLSLMQTSNTVLIVLGCSNAFLSPCLHMAPSSAPWLA